MKSFGSKIKKNDFIPGYEFHRSLSTLLRGCLCLCISVSLVSCATVPQQTYLNNASLSHLKKVAIVVSVNPPEVSYSINSPGAGSQLGWMLLFFPLLIFPAMGIEAAARSGVDQGDTSKIKEHVDISGIEDKMAQSFLQPLKKGNCFQTTEYIKDKNQNVKQLSNAGYNAVIRLSVYQISITRTAGDYVKLSAHVRGQMEKLMSGEIVWDREEFVINPEPQLLDYYKENGLKELDALLEKAGQNLAYDFVYLK